MKKVYFWLITILVLGAGCSPAVTVDETLEETAVPEASPTATPIQPTEPAETATATAVPQTPAQPESTAPAAGEAQSSETRIVFQRSGGFAGVEQEWVIYPDGLIELPDGVQKQSDADQVQALFETVQTADFLALAESYMPKDLCCDRFTYTITVYADGQTKTVMTMDDTPNQPEVLTAVLQTINELIQT